MDKLLEAVVQKIQTFDPPWVAVIVIAIIVGPKCPEMLKTFLEHRRLHSEVKGTVERQRRLTDVEIEKKKLQIGGRNRRPPNG